MAGISATGLVSGINTDAIIQKLLDLENQQVTELTNQEAQKSTSLSSWTALQTSAFSLKAQPSSTSEANRRGPERRWLGRTHRHQLLLLHRHPRLYPKKKNVSASYLLSAI